MTATDRRGARRAAPAGEILALARTGYATEPLQRALAHAGIPHRVLGSLGLYERTEVRDALAYLTLVRTRSTCRRSAAPIGSPATRHRDRDRDQAGRLGARASRRRPDHRQRPRRRARRRPRPGGPRPLIEFGAGLDQSAPSSPPAGPSATRSIADGHLPGGLVRHHEHVRDHSPERRSPPRRRAGARGSPVALSRGPGL